MKYRWALLTAIVVIAAVTTAFLWQRYDPDRPLDKVGAVNIAASLTVSPATIWVAQDQGLFARAGLDARVTPCDTGKSCTEAMLRGDADLSAAAEFLATRIAFTNKELRILAATSFVHTIKLLALKQGEINGPGDIKGMRVGARLGTNGEYFLTRLLTLNGLTRDDITWVNLKPQAMADALTAGQVDAVLVWPPFTNRLKAQYGERLVEFDGQPGQDYYYLLLGRQGWLAQNGEIAERVMLALKWADEWIAAHPEETQAFIATKFDLPAADVADDLQGTRFSLSLPQTLLSAMESERDWLVDQGAITAEGGTPVADLLDLIALAPLKAVAPDAVTIIHADAHDH